MVTGMDLMPRVSVIVPTFNREAMIGRCLRSLLSQTLPSVTYEIVVVDDGSTDRTAFSVNLFIARQDEHLRLISHDENRGLPAALNTAIAAARGDLIVRVDSDDFVSKHFLQTLFLFMNLNPWADAVECDYELVNDAEDVIERVRADETPIGCGIMFRRDRMETVGLYEPALRVGEEREFRSRFERQFRIERLAIPLYRYRRHNHGGLTQAPVTTDTFV